MDGPRLSEDSFDLISGPGGAGKRGGPRRGARDPPAGRGGRAAASRGDRVAPDAGVFGRGRDEIEGRLRGGGGTVRGLKIELNGVARGCSSPRTLGPIFQGYFEIRSFKMEPKELKAKNVLRLTNRDSILSLNGEAPINLAQNKPPVRLQPMVYVAWLLENPKLVDGGPIELKPDLDYEDENAVILNSHHVNSKILPDHYAENTIIVGEYNEFTGFRIWVTPKGFDYLLMAHQTHYGGNFVTMDGRTFGNYPHFHELDLYRSSDGINPDTRRIVIEALYSGMDSASLLETFMSNYKIEDGREKSIGLPSRSERQWGLDEF